MKQQKKNKKGRSVTAAVQTARGFETLGFDRTTRTSRAEAHIFRLLRDTVPIIDAAIGKIIRLTGGFEVTCSDPAAEKALRSFLQTVPCGPSVQGVDGFVASVLDRLLTYGTAVNELVTAGNGRLVALYPAQLEDVDLRLDRDPLRPSIYTADGREVPHPERVLISALSPEPGCVYGISLLRGLPAMGEILLKIFSCVGVNFERLGNLRFAVTYRSPDGLDAGENRAEEIASAWSEAMRERNTVRDFIAVGDVDIKVIGADNHMPEISVPVRALLEQIVAKTGLPPFLLGLSWSSTERMSAQQADILTSELEYYRSVITPALLAVCRAYLRGEGFFCDVSLEWNNISLQDEKELAQSRLIAAQADEIISRTRGDSK